MIPVLAGSERAWFCVETNATIGGGSLPGSTLPSMALALRHERGAMLTELLRDLRTGDPAIYGRIEDGQLLIDLRTIPPESDATLAERLRRL